MSNSVLKGTGYILVHVPGMVMHHGTTQTTERIVNPDSEYLKEMQKTTLPTAQRGSAMSR